MNEMRSSGYELPLQLTYGVAALPLFDCVADQVNNSLHPGIGSLSLLQMINGPLLVVFAAALLWAFLKNAASLASIPLPVPGAIAMLALACTEELVRTGSLSAESLGPYAQMSYWIVLWALVAVLCRRQGTADILLRGLAIGAVATAVSVFLGFAFGTRQYYGADAVLSSAGWFDTAKMITGLLITGGMILLYLGRDRRTLLCASLSWFCFVACILTYTRAGWVAAGACIVWLALWAMLFAPRKRRSWLVPFLSFSLLVGIAVPAAVGPDKLLSRWTDVGQGEQAGSGRATFWKMAFDEYVEASPSRQAFGRGYVAMADMLLRQYGMDIRHTHNDTLDMLTVAGLCGAAWLLLFIATLFHQVIQSSIFTIEGAIAMAILLIYLLHGQLTGQLWGTGIMTYYTIAITCLRAKAAEAKHTPRPSAYESIPLILTPQAVR